MWCFMDDSQTGCFEDAASLLMRVQDIAPKNIPLSLRLQNNRTRGSWADKPLATDTPLEDYIISQMLSINSVTRTSAHVSCDSNSFFL